VIGRGFAAILAHGILPTRLSVLVHHCRSPCWQFDCVHALCNAHLLRELVYVQEVTGQIWPQQMRDFLCQANTLCEVAQGKRKSRFLQDKSPLSARSTRRFCARGSRKIRKHTSSPQTRALQAVYCVQPVTPLTAIRRRATALYPQPRRALHQQQCRTRRAHAQSQPKNIRLLSHKKWRRQLRRHPLMSRHPPQAGASHDGGPASRFLRIFTTACLRLNSHE